MLIPVLSFGLQKPHATAKALAEAIAKTGCSSISQVLASKHSMKISSHFQIVHVNVVLIYFHVIQVVSTPIGWPTNNVATCSDTDHNYHRDDE